MNQNLFQTWQAVASQYTQNDSLIRQFWEELEKAYSAKSCYYHNLHHLEAMCYLADVHQQQLLSLPMVALANFYHDVVYSASSKVNEEKSAELAQRRLQALGVPQEEIALVEEMILATKNHQTHANGNPDVLWLLDFDLAILGAPWEKYLLYSQQIRKEYSLYPDFLYNPGRKKVLQRFLEKKTIYLTGVFQAEYEPLARINLEKEFLLLNAS
ncbi:hypothetical protein ACD591_20140 [Rufibacter glacialis]|uniref:Metal-dependent HD superfamily phosphohydrolase n=1 Tax=Rufibacter glacialis TaxID=1259555 RepID=A0A5M8Q750_9BACT|nr:hypothetical protein [Rufibacter glacialis]KAA6430650.1 hypothetical protein FOE74_19445 [Rufibacter glacialis]GGK85442.1 hypothetical protein GCM10011405_36630 [Rufibacter glacialis]